MNQHEMNLFNPSAIMEYQYVLDNSINREHEEAALRAKHPNLMEAWEQYQVLLALVKNGPSEVNNRHKLRGIVL